MSSTAASADFCVALLPCKVFNLGPKAARILAFFVDKPLLKATPVVAKPHFPWTKIVISSDEKRRPSRSLPGPFAAEQPADASYLSRVVRCAPASDEAPRGPNWQSVNRRTRRPKFHDERPATPRCLLALPTEASSFP